MVAAIEANVALHGSSRLAVTSAQSDEAWDGFLSRGNHSHVQSSLWGRLKAGFGWQVRRIRVETDGRIRSLTGNNDFCLDVLADGTSAISTVKCSVNRGSQVFRFDPF